MTEAVELACAIDGTLEGLASRAAALPGDRAWLDSSIGVPGRGDWSTVALELDPEIEVAGDANGVETRAMLADWDRSRVPTPGRRLGCVGTLAWEAARFFDPAHREPPPVPIPVIRFDRVRAALFARHGGVELVVDGDTPADAAARRDWWIGALTRGAGVASAPVPSIVEPHPRREQHRAHVEAIVEAIRAGRVYQACYTHPWWFEGGVDLFAVWQTLRRRSPGDFGAWLRMGAIEVASTSPERFVSISADGWIESRPMKGTRRRVGDDAALARELASSPKDRAENIMIVDLVRNDIGRVAVPGSVSVPSLCQVERYETVLQMTSTVRGRLREGAGRLEAIGALFPPGSMSGAPRIEACHLLGELEAQPRGLYGGSIVWWGHDGTVRSSVVIRTLQRWGDRTRWDVGGGIVADSDPDDEWLEAVTKAAPMGIPADLG